MKSAKYIYFLFISFLILGCNNEKKDEDKKVIVKVFDVSLYDTDIKGLVPQNASYDDSVSIVQSFINNWIQNQIMLHYANIYLKDQIKDIEKKAIEYKNTLLVHNLSQLLISTNIDSNVTYESILDYYEKHPQDFKLESTIIKGFFVKISKTADSLSYFKSLISSMNESELDAVFHFCQKNNGTFDDFTRNWSRFNDKIMKLPLSQTDEYLLIRDGALITAEDNDFLYYLKIYDFISKGKTAPLEFVNSTITKILMQKKSDLIINTFKQQKYDDAVKNGQIQFFNIEH